MNGYGTKRFNGSTDSDTVFPLIEAGSLYRVCQNEVAP